MGYPARRAEGQPDTTDLFIPQEVVDWPGLSPGTRVVWAALWNAPGAEPHDKGTRQPGSITTTFIHLADKANVSEKTARRGVATLMAVGLIEEIDPRPPKGVLSVYVHDYREVKRVRPRLVKPDPQKSLFSAIEDCPDILAPKCPAHTNDTKEIGDSNLPRYQEQRSKEVNDSLKQIPFQTEHIDAEGRARGVGPIGGDIAAALKTFTEATDPHEQRERLKTQIMAVCNWPDPVAEWAAGEAARLVVYDGLHVGYVDRVLGDVEAMRQVGTLKSAGRLFVSKMQSLVDQHIDPDVQTALRRK